MVVFGSYAKFKLDPVKNYDLFIPGLSDIDIVLIIDTNIATEPTRELQNVVESLNSILFEPIYAPILDLSILESDIDLPPPVGANFNLLHLHGAITSGLVLYGKAKYLKTFEYDKNQFRIVAQSETSKIYHDLKNAYLHRDIYRVPELFWMGVDSVLQSSLSYANYLKFETDKTSLVKLEVAEFLNKQDLSDSLKKVVSDAIDFTLNGGPPDGHFEYFVDSLRFCRKISEFLK